MAGLVKNKMNDFLNTLKGKVIGAICGLIVLFLVSKWDSISATFDTGKQLEKQSEFNSNIINSLDNDSVTDKILNNEKFVEKLLLHPKIKEFTDEAGMSIRDKIITDVTRKDSTKINANAYLSKELKIRDEDFLPLMKSLLQSYKNGELTTKKDVEKILNRKLKPEAMRNSHIPSF